MKQLSKIMLATVASVALAAPAFAWDFTASGSTTATWNQYTSTANNTAGTNAKTTARVHGEGGSLSLGASHTDGDKTASVSYTLDWDDNLDEAITVSGSNKVGKWTASGSVSYDPQRAGCSAYASSHVSNPTNANSSGELVGDNVTSAADNGTVSSTIVGPTACAGDQTDNDMAAITLTDGTMTIVFGEAAHLSGQNVSSSSVAGGSVTLDSVDADASVGAMIDSYQGVSVGYAISDTMNVTVAYQAGGATEDGFGTGEPLDGETTATHGVSGFGLGFSGTFGPATIGFTQASSSTADESGVTANGLLSTSWSTMGAGVKIDLGDIDPFISFGSATGSAGSTANKTKEYTHSGSEVGLTYALGTDTIVLYVGNSEDKYSTTDKALTKSGMEVGYNTTVGPVSLGVGYGTQTKADADKACGTVAASCDGFSSTDIEVNMGFSF